MRKLYLSAAVLAALLMLASCGGPGGGGAVVQTASKVPAGDYVGVFGMKPAAIHDSAIYKRLKSEEGDKAAEMIGNLEANAKEFDLEIGQLREMTAFMPQDMASAVSFLDADTTPEKLVEISEAKEGAEYEEAEIEGHACWLDKNSDKAIAKYEGSLMLGSKDAFEKMFTAEKYLSDDEAFKKASALSDAGASFYALYWGDQLKMAGAFAGMMFAETEGGAEAAATLAQMEAIGLSAYVTDAVDFKIRIAFGPEANVSGLATFFNEKISELVDTMAGMAAMMAEGAAPNQEKAKELAKKIKFTAGGNVLEISMKLTYDDIKSMMPEATETPEMPTYEEPEDIEEPEGGEEPGE